MRSAFLTATSRAGPRAYRARAPEQEDEATPSDPGRLDGTVAVVTGAGRGIGRHVAIAFAQRCSGWSTGAIVVIGSMTGKRPLFGRAPYCASTMGLVGLVRTLAWEAGEHGVRVNLVSPCPVDGPRVERVIEEHAAAAGITIDAARERIVSASPLGRLTDPRDVAAAAVFLGSPASGSITGEDMNVSAGLPMY